MLPSLAVLEPVREDVTGCVQWMPHQTALLPTTVVGQALASCLLPETAGFGLVL